MLKRLLIFTGLLGAASILQAQAHPTASRVGDLQIGAGFSTASPDYSSYDRFNGFGIYTDFDFRPHIGVEAEFHFVKSPSPDDFYEKTYEIGGRYFRTYGHFVPYAKVMVGRGVFNFQFSQANLAYNMLAGGAGLDYKLKPYLNLRGDVEFQHWSGFPGAGGQSSALSPLLATFGVAYHFK